mmetsp:Transcript_47831/g.84812  ORF Transcript_47831/g.84812 Transcript_47831/m.84812 type:complete len:380 (-) Transcript_47831:98-1237(-)
MARARPGQLFESASQTGRSTARSQTARSQPAFVSFDEAAVRIPKTFLSPRINQNGPGITPVRRNPFDPPARGGRERSGQQSPTGSFESARSNSAPSIRSQGSNNMASSRREFVDDGSRLYAEVTGRAPSTGRTADPVIRREHRVPGAFPVDALGNPVCLSTTEPITPTSCITIGGGKKKFDHPSYNGLMKGAAGMLSNRGKQKPRSVLTPDTPLSPFANTCNDVTQMRAGVMTLETKRARGVKPMPGWVSRQDFHNVVSGCVPLADMKQTCPDSGAEIKVTRDELLNTKQARHHEILMAAGISNEELNHVGQQRMGNSSGKRRRERQGLGTMPHMSSTVDSLVWGHDLDHSTDHKNPDDIAWQRKFEGAAGQPSEKRYR